MNKIKTSWFLLIVTISMYVAFGLVTSVIGVIIDKFQEQYNVSLQIAALLPFAFYLSYGLLSVPFGLTMDRIGARFVLLLGMVLMTIGSFLLYFSNNYIVVFCMIFIIGAGVTAIQTAGNPFIRELDRPTRYTANLTIVIGVGALGYAFSPLLLALVESKGYSWSTIYLLFGVINFILLILLLFAKFPEIKLTKEEKIQSSLFGELIKNPIILTYALGIFLYVGAEVGTSSYILLFMQKVHGVGARESLWSEGEFLFKVFPSVSALIVALFWFLQAVGRLIMGPMMKYISARKIFIFHSAGTVVVLLIAIFGSKTVALISYAIVGYFTAASFTAIFSATIQSFDKHHGTISGILSMSIVGGAILGFLVGFVGDLVNMQIAMLINVLAFSYVFILSVWGKGKLDIM